MGASPQPKLPPILPPPGSVPGSGSGFVSGIEAAAASALTLANNIAFRPMGAQPAKCSKLKIRIFYDSTIFQAGGNLFGRMEVTATSSRSLKLGEIAVELAAYEEITSKDFTATQSFLSSRLCFQGPNIPPSNAVHGPCDENGFWMAKKGKTTFPFAFQLPLDCPSSLVFGQTASLRYVVTGMVQVFYHGKDETILKTKEAFVVEAWDGYNPDYRLPIRASNSTKLFWGGSGSLELEAMLSEKLHSAGGNLTVEVKVKNNTSRKVQGIRLGVVRKLEMVSNKDKAQRNPGLKIATVSVSEVMGTQEFKSSSYLFDTGEERTTTVNMIVPGNARTIRGTALFEVTCFVVISMLLGTFSGELSVEIPVKICHPASLTPAPKPQLDNNHLPHLYNLVDEDLDLESDRPSRSNRRVGSNDSLAITSSGNRQPDDGSGRQDDYSGIGRHGEWNQDARELSPANSITSIRSILSSPKQKLSKLADKIQRSTSPSSSGHIQHEHRQGSKHLDDPNGQGRRQMPKSPLLGPALPIAYVPAVERVRYTPFQPPPTTKAKEFLKAAAQYQQEMAIGGALAGLGDDNVEFDLDDKKMASAIHNWMSRKESEALYHSQSPPIQIPSASPNRQRPTVGRINTQVGSFTSQHSPLGSPQSYDSPISIEGGDDLPRSPSATSFSDQTTSRFLHHPHRQPAAPQTEAFGSAPEDCITDPPLFAKPLPLPSSPRATSPLRTGVTKTSKNPRPLSPGPVPIQTPESLALAREAFERVKRIASPVQDNMINAASPSNGASRSGLIDPPRPSSLELNPSIKVPIPISANTELGTSPSGLSRLLKGNVESASHPKHARDGHTIENIPPRSCPNPDLQHVPMNRPLPIPAPKPKHLNQSNNVTDVNASNSRRELAVRAGPGSAPRPVEATSSGKLRNPQPAASSTSPYRDEQSARSGHLNERTRDNHTKAGSVQQNTYVPKPTPVPTSRPPAPIQHTISSAPKNARVDNKAPPGNKPNGQNGGLPSAQTASGFVYPKAARKPVPGTKPAVAAKPKGLATPSNPHGPHPPRLGNSLEATASSAATNSQSHAELDQRLRRHQQNSKLNDTTLRAERPLGPMVSMKAPQAIMESRTTFDGIAQASQVISAIRKGGAVEALEEREGEAEEAVSSAEKLVPIQDSRGRRDLHKQRENSPHSHIYPDKTDNLDTGETGVPTLDQGIEREQETSEIRAQAIAAANSFRATGANSGGYIVDTGKLRQVIKDQNNSGSGSGSGHLIQALADGAGALIAASAAASGLGWRQTSSTPAEMPGEPLRQSQISHRHQDSAENNKGIPLHSNHCPVDQPHDLTMKDIHFQTLSPMDYHQIPTSYDPPESPMKGLASPPKKTVTTKTTTTTTTTTTATKHKQRHAYEGTKSHHLISSTAETQTAARQPQSKSLPGSRVIDNMPRQEPLAAVPSAIAVEAIADSVIAAAVAAMPAPNLDKTLPKIQEPAPRSRVFERPVSSDVKLVKSNPPRLAPKQVSQPTSYSKPLPKPRQTQGSGENSTPTNSVVGSAGAAPK
ncbi:hypothetical protein BGZ80_007455, partial [Entomortierella chlamydospora]